jgi:hypothetical protein
MVTTPKLYLIESHDRADTIKIGRAGSGEQTAEDNAVEIRIAEGYLTGISDPSTVYETPGTRVFEEYLHQFLTDYKKPIPITFKPSNKVRPGPREWFFHLRPSAVTALSEAFLQKHPTRLDEIDLDDLPVFLSGLFSAIQWEANYTNLVRSAEAETEMRLRDIFARYQYGKLSNFGDAPVTGIGDIDRVDQEFVALSETLVDAQSRDPEFDLLQEITSLFEQRELLKNEIVEMQQAEKSQIIVALVGIICTIYLWWVGGSMLIFAFFTLGLLAAWPRIHRYAVVYAVNLGHWLEANAANARQKARRHE